MRHQRFVALALLVALATAASGGLFPQADILVAAQTHSVNPAVNGSWPPASQAWETGFIIPGLVRAYELSNDPAYKTSAELGGTWILNNRDEIPPSSPNSHHFVGEEAYAMMRLSQINTNPASNPWRTEITNFYQDVSDLSAVAPGPHGDYPADYPGNVAGTAGYIDKLVWFSVFGPEGYGEYSIVCNNIAHHVVAADYVNATDLPVWREGLVKTLSMVTDDTAVYPVMALGAAVWALASTEGGLDTTEVDPLAEFGDTWWIGDEFTGHPVELWELPGILGGHQDYGYVGASGTFYWRFDHAEDDDGGPALGYTEDTVFGTLGLQAATANGYGMYDLEVLAGQNALSRGWAFWGGYMGDHLWEDANFPPPGSVNWIFTGEAMRLLTPEPGSMVLLGYGLAALIVRRRRRGAGHQVM